MGNFHIGSTKIEYDLIYTDRKKTMELVIDLENGFSVKAPRDMRQEDIIKNLERKSKWIITHLDRMADVTRNNLYKEFLSGEKFLLRGRRYRLKVQRITEKRLPSLAFENSIFKSEVPSYVPENEYYKLLRPLFIQFYKQKAEIIINQRVRKYLKYFKEDPTKILIKSLKDKWGSCSPMNRINYNWKIIMAKTSVLDYVIVHELCHMKNKNHSKSFWNDVKTILPNYQISKEWLRINGDLLKI